jgi:hypothetical protein
MGDDNTSTPKRQILFILDKTRDNIQYDWSYQDFSVFVDVDKGIIHWVRSQAMQTSGHESETLSCHPIN